MKYKSEIRKIHVIGGAGSGKTTLARKLSNELACPNYDLDQIAWNSEGKIRLDIRLADIEKIIKQGQWITEGVFLWWTEQLLVEADHILFLDIPYRITSMRIIKRHIKANMEGNNPHPGIMNLARFLISVGKQYYRKEPIIPEGPDDDFAITRTAMIAELEKYSAKVIYCRSEEDVENAREWIVLQRRNFPD